MRMYGRDIADAPSDEELKQAPEIAEKIYPMLFGLHPTVQGAIIADLTATWLAGHVVEGSPEDTNKLRKFLFEQHIRLTHKLIEPNADHIGTTLMAAEGGSH